MSKVKQDSAETLDKDLNEQETNEIELNEVELDEKVSDKEVNEVELDEKVNDKEVNEIKLNEEESDKEVRDKESDEIKLDEKLEHKEINEEKNDEIELSKIELDKEENDKQLREKKQPNKVQNKGKKKQKGKKQKKANSQEVTNMQKEEKVERKDENCEKYEKDVVSKDIVNEQIENTNNLEKIEEVNNLDRIKNLEKVEKNIEENIEKENKQTNVTNIEKDYNNEKANKKLTKYAIIIATISSILIIAVIVFSVIFALITKNSSKIVSGVSIKGIDVSGLTRDEAKEKINNTVKPNLEQDIQLIHNEYTTAIIPKQIEANFGVDTAVNMAYSIGRDGSILKDNYTIINTHLNKVNINPSFSYNQKILEDFIENISDNLPDKVTQSSYCIEDRNLVISKGKKGYIVQNEELRDKIVDNIVNLKQENTIEIPVIEQQPNPIDIETIRNEIYKEPKDAYYTKEPFTVYPHVNGVDIKMSVEEAKNLVANSAEEDITIPLKITTPNITTNKIGTEAFPNLLASFSTKFSTANGNRTTNIKLATSKINGVVLMPGETFSYNQVVGKRTVNAGFKEAHMFQNGQVIDGVGGGICQVSSTLYNTVLLSNLEIVERKNHSFNTGYVKIGTDATVSWGGPDFKFKNSRNYPIKLVGRVSGGTVTIDIYGLKEQNEYEVVIESQVLQKIPRKVEYRNTTNLPTGQQKVVQTGYDGFKSRTYKILKLNGSVVSRNLLSTDTYSTQAKIIEVGQ